MWGNPLIYHLICALGGIYIGSHYLGSADAPQVDKMLLTIAGGSVFAFFILELIAGIIIKLCMDEPHPKNFLKAFAAAFSLTFTCFVYLPSETYLNNASNFRYVYWDFAPYIFIKTIVISLLAAVAACALKQKVFRIVGSLAAGLVLCTYCQYMFMNGDLPASIGDPMDWDALKTKAVINAIIWVVILLIPLAFTLVSGKVKALKKSSAAQNAPIGAAALIGGIQLLSLGIMLFTTSAPIFGTQQYILSSEEQFTVSRNKNIITFILDMSDRHMFDDAYEKYPEKFDFLKDFTYYTNAAMVYDSTILSIPQMLTGTTELPKDNGYNKWLENAWKSESSEEFYKRLHENNYKVNAYGNFGTYNHMVGKVDNCDIVEADEITVNSDVLYESITDMAAFRYLPLALKKSFEPDMYTINDAVGMPNGCIMDNVEYAQNTDLKKSDSDKNYFIVEHLYGSHYSDQEAGTLSSLDLLKKYVRILLGVLNADNTATTNSVYNLELLGTAEDCFVLRTQPSAEEWQRVLETVYNTALEDQEFAELLKKASKLSNTVNSSLGSSDADGESIVADFREILTEALKNAESTAKMLSELSYEIAFKEKRVHAVKLLDKEGLLAAYESTGTPAEERADAIMFRSAGEDMHLVRFVSEMEGFKTGLYIAPEIGLTAETASWKAENGETRFEWNLDFAGNRMGLSLLDEEESALLSARLDSFLGNGEINVLITDAEGEIVLPEGEVTEISSEEEFAAIFQKPLENASQNETAAQN